VEGLGSFSELVNLFRIYANAGVYLGNISYIFIFDFRFLFFFFSWATYIVSKQSNVVDRSGIISDKK
jgi:hypothetical protein